jgi:hypothetical protein
VSNSTKIQKHNTRKRWRLRTNLRRYVSSPTLRFFLTELCFLFYLNQLCSVENMTSISYLYGRVKWASVESISPCYTHILFIPERNSIVVAHCSNHSIVSFLFFSWLRFSARRNWHVFNTFEWEWFFPISFLQKDTLKVNSYFGWEKFVVYRVLREPCLFSNTKNLLLSEYTLIS